MPPLLELREVSVGSRHGLGWAALRIVQQSAPEPGGDYRANRVTTQPSLRPR